MLEAEEGATRAVSGSVQPRQTSAGQPAGQTEDCPTQEITSTTLASAGDTSTTPFERLSSSLIQSPAKETSPAGKTKARKPYTITKQREKWTEDEHALFLEALELHGRAWRRIEEHIGTKTAVQIRSHAQKFFSKLEKEQSGTVKTEGSCKSGGIDIPPPRPKRKPCHPYPRKPDQRSPDSHSPTTWQGSLAPGNAHFPRSLSHESLGTSAGCQPLQPMQSPFAQVKREPSSMQAWNQLPNPQQPSRSRTTGSNPIGDTQPQHCYPGPAPPSQEAVSAVAAAASAAAAAAAAAVIAAAGHDIQAQLQASPPKGFPFFGISPSAFSQLGWQSNGPLQPQAPPRNMPLASPGRSRSSDAGDGREATSELTHAKPHHTPARAQTQPIMSACGIGSPRSHHAAGPTPQWMAPPVPLNNAGLNDSSRQSHHKQPTWAPLHGVPRPLPQDPGHASAGALPSCMPPLPTAPFPPSVNMANPQSVYVFMSALQWWQTMGGSWLNGSPGSGRPVSGRMPGAHANNRQPPDAAQAQEQPGGSDGSDADNVRGNQGDQFGDNLLFRHMQLQRAETQDAGESARTQTRLQGAQPEGGDSNPGSEGNGSGSDGAGQCQGSGSGTGHSIHAGMHPGPAPSSTQPSETPPPHRDQAPAQAGHSLLHTATSQSAPAMSPPCPPWTLFPPAPSGRFPMGLNPSFQPPPLLNGATCLGQEQLDHMHASAFHAAAAAAAMATLAQQGPSHSQALPIDPLQRASSLLEQQMVSGPYQPPLAGGNKEGTPSWESSAALWHPTARRPVPCTSPSLSDCHPRAGSLQPAASAIAGAAVSGQTPLRAQSTPGLATIGPRRSGETAAAPMGLPPSSFGANSGFKLYQSSHIAADITGAPENKSSIPAAAPLKRKFSGHLASTAPPKKRHLALQQAA